MVKSLSVLLLTLFFMSCTTTKPREKTLEKKEYYALRGINLSYEGKYLEAIKELEIAYKKDPENPIVLRELGYSFGELGNLEKSKYYYEKALYLNSEDQISINNLARISYREGNYSVAENYLERISKDSIDVETLKLRGLIAYQNKDYETAYIYMRDALTLEENLDMELYKDFVEVMFETNRVTELYQTMEDGYDKYSSNRSYILGYTNLLSEKFNENNKAIRILKRYVAENGGEDLIYIQLARISLLNSDNETSRKAIDLVSDRYRYDIEYLRLKSEVLNKSGMKKKAIEIDKVIEELEKGSGV